MIKINTHKPNWSLTSPIYFSIFSTLQKYFPMKTEKGARVRNFVMFLCTAKTILSTTLCHVDYYITV